MLLNQIPVKTNTPQGEALTAFIQAELMAKFVLAKYLQFYSIKGNADTPRKVDTAIAAGATRAIGNAFTKLDNEPDFGAVALKIYGFAIKTDIAYERRGTDIGSQRRLDAENAVRSFARYLADQIINSTASGSAISGLKEMATDLSLKTILGGGSNGASLPSGNGNTERKAQDVYFEALDLMINNIEGGPSALLMNGNLQARMRSVGRSYMATTQIMDIYGQPITLETYNGVPIVNMGYNKTTGLIIPNDETEGTATTATSVYAVKFGEQSDVTAATNVGFMVSDNGKVDNNYEADVEIDIDLVTLNSKSLHRLSGIIL